MLFVHNPGLKREKKLNPLLLSIRIWYSYMIPVLYHLIKKLTIEIDWIKRRNHIKGFFSHRYIISWFLWWMLMYYCTSYCITLFYIFVSFIFCKWWYILLLPIYKCIQIDEIISTIMYSKISNTFLSIKCFSYYIGNDNKTT